MPSPNTGLGRLLQCKVQVHSRFQTLAIHTRARMSGSTLAISPSRRHEVYPLSVWYQHQDLARSNTGSPRTSDYRDAELDVIDNSSLRKDIVS